MSVSPEAAMRTLTRRYAALQSAWRARAERLVAQVEERIPEIARRHAAERVWLFGSLVWGTAFAHSDVDLAVQGLDQPTFDAFAAAAYMAIDAPVDVVRLEDAPPSLVARITEQGLAVFSGSSR